MSRPALSLIAGANGSGKTTLTRWNPEIFRTVPLLDPDSIANVLEAEAFASRPVAAARMVLESEAKYIDEEKSFAIETTLAGRRFLRTMQTARGRGFEIGLIYIGTENVEINLARIRNRVLAGGHAVPEEDVRRRYLRSLENLSQAVRLADHSILFDNSTDEGYRLVAILSGTETKWFEPRPAWLPSKLQSPA